VLLLLLMMMLRWRLRRLRLRRLRLRLRRLQQAPPVKQRLHQQLMKRQRRGRRGCAAVLWRRGWGEDLVAVDSKLCPVKLRRAPLTGHKLVVWVELLVEVGPEAAEIARDSVEKDDGTSVTEHRGRVAQLLCDRVVDAPNALFRDAPTQLIIDRQPSRVRELAAFNPPAECGECRRELSSMRGCRQVPLWQQNVD